MKATLIDACSSIHDYDVIDIIETRLDDTIDENKLTLHSYSLIKGIRPQNVKRDGCWDLL